MPSAKGEKSEKKKTRTQSKATRDSLTPPLIIIMCTFFVLWRLQTATDSRMEEINHFD